MLLCIAGQIRFSKITIIIAIARTNPTTSICVTNSKRTLLFFVGGKNGPLLTACLADLCSAEDKHMVRMAAIEKK